MGLSVALVPDIVRQLAEDPEIFIEEIPPPTRRIVTPELLLAMTPTHAVVSGLRTSGERLDEMIELVRGYVREAKLPICTWQVGPSSRPKGLGALLAARGFVPATRPPFEPFQTAMALASAPPSAADGIETRVVADFDEYTVALGIFLDTFGADDADRATWRDAAPNLWEHGTASRQTHVAYVDGRPAAFAFAVPTKVGLILGGSGVLPAARGRGAYRALVAARWDLAVRLGTPALAIHAGEMSRPILERCGFETICRVEILEDPVLTRA
jgi:GNAT superfamily N-acetyltransferase